MEMAVIKQWDQVASKIQQIVPGLNPCDLIIDLLELVQSSLSLSLLGWLWGRLVASSFVVKCKLLLIQENVKQIPFSDLNHLEAVSQAMKLVKKYHLSLTNIKTAVKETTEDTEISTKTLWMNTNIPTAHWDAIAGATPKPLLIQDQYTMKPPGSRDIQPQLSMVRDLLWIFPGCDEDASEPPREFKSPEVVKAIEDGRIAFLSGAGFINPLTLDIVILLKKQTELSLTKVNK